MKLIYRIAAFIKGLLVKILDSTLKVINEDIIEHNRGGFKGMHGFIAEVAECGVTNARRVVEGKAPNCIWINDNGPTDIVCDGVNIQQKFVANGNHLSLEAIRKHYDTYPWYLEKWGNIRYKILLIKSYCRKNLS